MTIHSFQPEVSSRGARMLRTALGPAIARYLEDPAVVEVMLNPDGRLWVDRLREGLVATDDVLIPADGERIVRLVAHHVGAEVHPGSPRVSAELPETGERFEGLLPPVVMAPTFAIRKPAVAVFTLTDYVAAGIMTAAQADVLRLAVERRKNILVDKEQKPYLIDFATAIYGGQGAGFISRLLFRHVARIDCITVAKLKMSYLPESLNEAELALLARQPRLLRLGRWWKKKIYRPLKPRHRKETWGKIRRMLRGR